MKVPDHFDEEDQLASNHLAGMASGDVESLKSLYKLYQRPLLAVIQAVTGDLGGSEEILQDVFVRAYRDAGRFDPQLGAPFLWLATIARRMAIDWLRKKQRRPGFVELEREQDQADADTLSGSNENSPQQHLEARLVLEQLACLPSDQGRAVELAFLRGYTHREIARILGKPLGTIKSDLRRGLLRLRKIYLGEND